MAAAWTGCTKIAGFFLAWWNPGAIRGFAVFMGVFEGSHGKTGVRNWFLCGQDVVKRMAKMGSGMLDFESRKFCRIPSYFFWPVFEDTSLSCSPVKNSRLCNKTRLAARFRLAVMNDATLTYNCSVCNRPDVVVMKLEGPLTLRNMFSLQSELATNRPPMMVFDLSGVSYMDSAGIGVLINYYVAAEKNARRMALAGVNERVDALLELTKVKGLLRSFATVDEAVEKV